MIQVSAVSKRKSRIGSRRHAAGTKPPGSPKRAPKGKRFPIVGVGASAGGLEAFQRLFSRLSPSTGMGYVLVQHLAPKPPSLLTQILARSTKMPVAEAAEGMRIEPDRVYVIPPNQNMEIHGGKLHLIPREKTDRPNLSIDRFLRSLAADQKEEAIGIILSGTGSDGAEGLKIMKSEGGITFAQSPDSAKYDGMPTRAIAIDHVDFVLSPEGIADELARLSRHPFLRISSTRRDSAAALPARTGDLYSQIFQLLKQSSGVDFSQYKHTTVYRRISRRMVLHKLDDLFSYLRLLKRDIAEQKALHNDILINVTSFFRDPKHFEVLKQSAFRTILENRSSQDPVRIWVAGCATGEEVYSIAICLLEAMSDRGLNIPIQIFATDLSESCIEIARTARYPDSIRDQVSPERLRKFFTEAGGTYRVNKAVRDLCVFAKHDVTRDAPFSRMDLISCRNLLIYLQPLLQRQVLSTFAYALKPKGFLFMGSSDSTGLMKTHFSPVEKRSSIYQAKAGVGRVKPGVYSNPRGALRIESRLPVSAVTPTEDELDREIDRMIVTHIAPCSVAVNDAGEVIRFRGDTSPYLTNPSGRVSQNIFKMAREGLAFELRAAFEKAKSKNSIVVRQGLRFKSSTMLISVDVEIHPIRVRGETRCFLIVFRGSGHEVKGSKSKGQSKRMSASETTRVRELMQELNSTREYLEALNRDLEGANQELQSANEEVLSGNEELQSTNEEIETAKEELQSTNEELATVNDELQNRNQDLDRLSNDLINFIGSVEIPIVMISKEGRIRRFTPKFEKMLNLIPTDIGRPISDIRSNFEALNLDVDLGKMVSDKESLGIPSDTEVQDRSGHWYRLQIRPYRTVEGQVDGAVVALIDIHALKSSLGEIQKARQEADRALLEAEAGNRAKDIFLATLSHELRTPLTTILSFVEMLLLKKLDEAKSQRALEMIRQSAYAQAQLINDLLDVSRIIMGKLDLELKDVDPGDIVRVSVDSVTPLAESKQIKIETIVPPGRHVVMADPVRLKQIVWNLLTNAIKFSPSDSKIVVELTSMAARGGEQGTVQIRVTDAGKGVPADFLPHIFDRFSQADSSSTRKHGGMGLGLAIVRNLVELMGGTVKAESRGEGKGASFLVQFPLKAAGSVHDAFVPPVDEMSELKRMAIPGENPTLNDVKVLIVDDDAGARESLSLVLASFGAEVEAAGSASDALDMVARFRPDVLVSDIAMPGEDGYSLIGRIRRHSDEKIKRLPAIALSAFAAKRDTERTLQSGFDRHLSKPIGALQLVGQILEISKGKRAR